VSAQLILLYLLHIAIVMRRLTDGMMTVMMMKIMIMIYVIDTARILRTSASIKRYGVHPSVCPSVCRCSKRHSSKLCSTDSGGRPAANASSVMLTAKARG